MFYIIDNTEEKKLDIIIRNQSDLIVVLRSTLLMTVVIGKTNKLKWSSQRTY